MAKKMTPKQAGKHASLVKKGLPPALAKKIAGGAKKAKKGAKAVPAALRKFAKKRSK